MQLAAGSILLAISRVALVLFSSAAENLASPLAPNVEYEAGGHVSYTAFRTNGSVLLQEERTFSVWVKGENWRVRTAPTNTTHSVDDYCEIAKDGPDVYTLLVFSTTALQTPVFETNRETGNVTARSAKGGNIAAGSIRRSLVPASSFSSLAPEVWLALASDSYFRLSVSTSTNTSLRVIWPLSISGAGSLDLEGYLPAKWSLISESWRLPAQITYFRHQVSSDLRREAIDGDIKATNATYEVLGYTNVGAVVVPQHFRLLRFGKTPDPSSGAPRILVQVLGTVSSIRAPLSTPRFIPALPGKTTIEDFRASEVVKYKSDDRMWLPLAEVEKRRAQRLLSPADVPRQRQAMKRLIISLLMAALVVGPLTAVYFRTKCRKQQHRK